ncbi:hypothetical protein AAFX20_17240 [Vibrio chagasii]|uniref:polysialyltransferase family glycosyltransferase n=1 Tax=Vibrio chagasii TaxID=170679 RepID=UPI0038CD5703
MKNKNIYICSTVRHLLFSLYKASDDSSYSLIVFFYDYQDIDPKNINTKELPNNIELVLVSRRSLVKKIKESGLLGKYILFSSLHGLATSKTTKLRLVQLLKENNIAIERDYAGHKLFLFNDNNKMSRLFRLLFRTYSMVEDGMGNYIEHRIESKPKQLIRLLSNRKPLSYVFGEKKQCDDIYVIHPDKLPKSVIHKGKKLTLPRDINIISTVQSCFIFNDNVEINSRTLIIATQPTFKKIKNQLRNNQFFFEVYNKIISEGKRLGFNVVLKLHPKENQGDYFIFKDNGIDFLSNKIPLELYLLSNIEKTNIISINSSAGIGMEEFCNIYKLIPDSDVSNFVEIIKEFENNTDNLNKTISTQLSKMVT